jgi:hypothetical protein
MSPGTRPTFAVASLPISVITSPSLALDARTE